MLLNFPKLVEIELEDRIIGTPMLLKRTENDVFKQIEYDLEL
jgi:hypothetical protein